MPVRNVEMMCETHGLRWQAAPNETSMIVRCPKCRARKQAGRGVKASDVAERRALERRKKELEQHRRALVGE